MLNTAQNSRCPIKYITLVRLRNKMDESKQSKLSFSRSAFHWKWCNAIAVFVFLQLFLLMAFGCNSSICEGCQQAATLIIWANCHLFRQEWTRPQYVWYDMGGMAVSQILGTPNAWLNSPKQITRGWHRSWNFREFILYTAHSKDIGQDRCSVLIPSYIPSSCTLSASDHRCQLHRLLVTVMSL